MRQEFGEWFVSDFAHEFSPHAEKWTEDITITYASDSEVRIDIGTDTGLVTQYVPVEVLRAYLAAWDQWKAMCQKS